MAQAYLEELVSAETEDGLLLDGAVIRPTGTEVKPLAVVWIHGFTGKFYEPFILHIGRDLAGYGYTLVTGNNRGHHCGATMDRVDGEPMLAGGWWERLDQSPHDVAAWIDFAANLGFRRVALLGHSLGAMKVPYYQAQRQDSRVAGMVVASPPLGAGRLSPQTIGRAEALDAEGRGEDLLPWGSRGGFSATSAQTFLSWGRVLHLWLGRSGPGNCADPLSDLCPLWDRGRGGWYRRRPGDDPACRSFRRPRGDAHVRRCRPPLQRA